MTMTDTKAKALALVSIDPKALEHACLSVGRSVHHFDRMGDDLPLRSSIVAHARAIERLESTEARHAAELRELKERFSEAASLTLRMLTPYPFARDEAEDILTPFIFTAPDPLVEVFREMDSKTSGTVTEEGYADEFRAALAARGGKIVWEDGE